MKPKSQRKTPIQPIAILICIIAVVVFGRVDGARLRQKVRTKDNEGRGKRREVEEKEIFIRSLQSFNSSSSTSCCGRIYIVVSCLVLSILSLLPMIVSLPRILRIVLCRPPIFCRATARVRVQPCWSLGNKWSRINLQRDE